MRWPIQRIKGTPGPKSISGYNAAHTDSHQKIQSIRQCAGTSGRIARDPRHRLQAVAEVDRIEFGIDAPIIHPADRAEDAVRMLAAASVPASKRETRARAIYAAVAGAQLMARGRADMKLFDALIDSFRALGLIPT